MLPLFLALQAAALPDSVAGRGSPDFAVPRLEAEIVVDGALDEPAWGQAVRLTGFHGYQPADGRPAAERTEVLVWYSPTAIHFGIRAHDSRPETVRATLADRDRIDQEDRVTLLLDTFDDRRRAFLFAVNALGVQQDGVRSEGSASAGSPFGGSTDLSPDYEWQSRGRRTAWGWQAEVRIPFKSLRYDAGGSQRWGLQVTRHVQRAGHEDTWTDVRRGSASFLAQSATMTGLHDLRRGVVVEAQPFVTASSAGARPDPAGPFTRDDPEASTGLNARLGFASISLDATINPDFSQVESDAGLVTANERFPLFVAEKRPFFLEGIELFASPNQLVYTRRVVDPLGGAKLTGKVGRWGVAYLSALDESPDSRARDALFNVLRLRRDVGTSSVLGITASDRRAGGAFNSVGAGDARIVFGKYYVEGQAGVSRTDRGDGEAGPWSPFWSAEFDRTGRSWGFNYSLETFDDAFETQAGFIPRVGIVRGGAFNRLTWYGATGGRVESVQTFFGPSYLWRHGAVEEGPIEGNEFVNSTLRLRGGWELGLRLARDFADFLPGDYARLTAADPDGGAPVPFVPSAGVRGLPTAQLTVETPVFRHYNATLEVAGGAVPLFAEAAEGHRRQAELELALRPTTQLRADVSVTWQRLLRERDDSEFARTVIPRLRVEFQPTRALFFRTVAQYRAERRAALQHPVTGTPLLADGTPVPAFDTNGLRLEWLASFEPTPGTVAFLGYAVDLAERDPLAFDGLRAMGDGVFLKVAYQFRR